MGGLQASIEGILFLKGRQIQRDLRARTSRFVGRLEADLAQYDRYVSDQSLQSRLDEISSEIRRLTEEVDETALRAKLERALLRITTLMSRAAACFGGRELNRSCLTFDLRAYAKD